MYKICTTIVGQLADPSPSCHYSGQYAVTPTGGQSHQSAVSASPASEVIGSGGGGAVSSCGSATSGAALQCRQDSTVIEMWLAEPYQVVCHPHSSLRLLAKLI